MSRRNTSPRTKDGLRFLTFRLTFEVERNVWTRVPVFEESFLCAGTCSIQLSELSTGYGKFEYTREGVNQANGVCLFCKPRRALIVLNSPSNSEDPSMFRDLSDPRWAALTPENRAATI